MFFLFSETSIVIKFLFTQANHRAPGTWAPLNLGDALSATVVCPACCARVRLVQYTIAADGEVSGEVTCPTSVGCGFELEAVLDGWNAQLELFNAENINGNDQ